MLEITKVKDVKRFCAENNWEIIKKEELNKLNDIMKKNTDSKVNYYADIIILNIYNFSFEFSKVVKTKVNNGNEIGIAVNGYAYKSKLEPIGKNMFVIVVGEQLEIKFDPSVKKTIKKFVTERVKSYICKRHFINTPVIKEIAESLEIPYGNISRGIPRSIRSMGTVK